MKLNLLAFNVVAVLTVGSNAQDVEDPISCSREGPFCKDCNTLGHCVTKTDGTPGFEYDGAKEENCAVGFVCDEWTLRCEREGTCRYKAPACPSDTKGEEVIFPNPYSCIGYYGCTDGDRNDYKCDPGKAFDPKKKDCSLVPTNPLCNDYPALCETAGKTGTIGDSDFRYVCKEEAGTQHVIYPEITGSGGTNPPTTPTAPTTPYPCEREGYFKDPLSRTKFYVCYWIGNGYGSKQMSCRKGSYFDPGASRCVKDIYATTPTTPVPIPTTTPPPYPCESEGYFPDTNNPKCFFVCYSIGKKNNFGNKWQCCRKGSTFDGNKKRCVPQVSTPPPSRALA